jgi:hypothetical protein
MHLTKKNRIHNKWIRIFFILNKRQKLSTKYPFFFLLKHIATLIIITNG